MLGTLERPPCNKVTVCPGTVMQGMAFSSPVHVVMKEVSAMVGCGFQLASLVTVEGEGCMIYECRFRGHKW